MKVYVLMIGYEAEEVRVFTTRELAEQAQSAVGHPIVGIEECELERPVLLAPPLNLHPGDWETV